MSIEPVGIHRTAATERVRFGEPAATALAQEAKLLGFRRALIVTNRSLLAQEDMLDAIRAALGGRCAGVFAGIRAHAPAENVVEAIKAARDCDADIVIGIGGGSVIDACKGAIMSLWHDVTDINGLRGLTAHNLDDSSLRPALPGKPVRMIAVPTTLSAAEFAWFGGMTDAETGIKIRLSHPLLIPQVIVLDPTMTLATPTRLFLSTGVKAVDHAVERICARNANPISDAYSHQALQMIARALPEVMDAPDNLKARLDCQVAMWLSTMGGAMRVIVGASHGIGHVLGSHCGVPHGETSCIMLPAVLDWNSKVNAERQKGVSATFGDETISAAEHVRNLVSRLSLPARLSEVSVEQSQFEGIAERAMHDRLIKANPRTVESPSDIIDILRSVA